MGGPTKNPKINKRGGGLLFGTGEYRAVLIWNSALITGNTIIN